MVLSITRPCLWIMTKIYHSEFNHVKNEKDECVLVPGTTPLPDDDSCRNGEDYWYERTPYRLIAYSSCENGERPDRGARHVCPGFKSHGGFFWLFILVIPFGFTALVAYYYYRRSGMARGYASLRLNAALSYVADPPSQDNPVTWRYRTIIPGRQWHHGYFSISPLVLDWGRRHCNGMGGITRSKPRLPSSERISGSASRRRCTDPSIRG